MTNARVRGLSELLDSSSFGRQLVDGWLAQSSNRVELLTVSEDDGARCLEAVQVTSRSPMGAIAYSTGGILVDGGWIRVLGAGSPRLPRSLASWNGLPGNERLPGALLVGDDAIGGFFALNGGRFEGNLGSMFYFAPDTLRWKDLNGPYSEWLQWLLSGDLEDFYAGLRWTNWRRDVAPLSGDTGMLIYPLPSAEGPGFDARERSPVPVGELWEVYVERLAPMLSATTGPVKDFADESKRK